MSDIQTKPARFKKRYVAIAALAGLIATGGIVGATVTAESTIAGNKLTITAPPGTDALVTVTGEPLKLEFAQGADIITSNTKATFVVKNDGEQAAVVSVEKIKGLENIQTTETDTGQVVVKSPTGGEMYIQSISGNAVNNPAISNPITVPGKSEVTITAHFYLAHSKYYLATDREFDLEFKYINKVG